MAPRANWKGFLKIDEVVCPIALYAAASTSERIALHVLNRETGHRVRRQFVDEDTGKPVASEDQVKGYERAPGDYVVLEPDEIASAVPESDKTLAVQAFIRCDQVDDVYFDRPYYLGPGDPAARETYALVREGLRARNVVAIARTVLFRRMRTVLVRAHGEGLIAATLNFDYEVRSAAEAFKDISPVKIEKEMLDLARHIIATKRGQFDPKTFDDRYERALEEVVRAKLEGRLPPAREPAPASNVIDLMDALRRSAGAEANRTAATPARPKSAEGKRAAKAKKTAPAKNTTRTGKTAARSGRKKAS